MKALLKTTSLVLTVALIITTLTFSPFTVWASTTADYIDEFGNAKTAAGVAVIDSSNIDAAALATGWYLFSGTAVKTSTLTVAGDVNIILEDGCDFIIDTSTKSGTAGLAVAYGNSVTIYSQSANSGRLKAVGAGTEGGAGIGGNHAGVDGVTRSGMINIFGGDIEAEAPGDGAGIGGGKGQCCGKIVIGGNAVVKATGGAWNGAGIGSGTSTPNTHIGFGDHDIIIRGDAEVYAYGGSGGAGIGGGYNSSGRIIIYGNAFVRAEGSIRGGDRGGAGIGGGTSGFGYINISGNVNISAKGGSANAPGIGGGGATNCWHEIYGPAMNQRGCSVITIKADGIIEAIAGSDSRNAIGKTAHDHAATCVGRGVNIAGEYDWQRNNLAKSLTNADRPPDGVTGTGKDFSTPEFNTFFNNFSYGLLNNGNLQLYSVIVSSDGYYSNGDGSYEPNEIVTIYAGIHPEGKTFVKWWVLSNSGVTFADATNVTTTFIMPNKNVIIYALFDGDIEPDDDACVHIWGSWNSTATCETPGTETRTCTVNACIETKPASVLGHNMGAWGAPTPPTCVADSTQTRYCQNTPCAHSETEDLIGTHLDHDWTGTWAVIVIPSCTGTGINTLTCERTGCSAYQTEAIDPDGHDWDNWDTVDEPLCEVDGYKERECKAVGCDVTEHEVIDALEHNFEISYTTDIEPTCLTVGSQSHHCQRINCGAKNDIQETPALGHDWINNWAETVAPTCTTAGEERRICGRTGCVEHQAKPVAAHGHDWGTGWATTIAPACTATGTETRTCLHNPAHIENNTLAAINHDWGDWGGNTATCLATGIETRACANDPSHTETRGTSALGHKISGWGTPAAPTCTVDSKQTRVCENFGCTYSETEDLISTKLGHDWTGDWVVTDAISCTGSGMERLDCKRSGCSEYQTRAPDSSGHNWSDWVTVIEAICQSDGYKERECRNNNCDVSEHVDIDALGHAFSPSYTKDLEPTCLIKGSHSRHCTRADCNAKYDIGDVPALGHEWLENWIVTIVPSCLASGIETRVCNRFICEEKETTAVSATGHKMGGWNTIIPPLCTVDRKKARICENSGCSHTETDYITGTSLGHDWSGNWVETNLPSCTGKGIKTLTCKRAGCSEYQTTAIDPFGHNWSGYITVDPTCEKDGNKERDCQNAGCEVYEHSNITALGHLLPLDYTTDLAPNCINKGSKSYHCTRAGCNAKNDVLDISAFGHDWDVWTVITAPTFETAGLEKRICKRIDCTEYETRSIDKLKPQTTKKPPLGGGSGYYYYPSSSTAATTVEQQTSRFAAVTTKPPPAPVTKPALTTAIPLVPETVSIVYKVSFDSNGADVHFASMEIGQNGRIVKKPNPERDGFIFNGWYTEPIGGVRITEDSVFEQADVMLYAQWVPIRIFGMDDDKNPHTGVNTPIMTAIVNTVILIIFIPKNHKNKYKNKYNGRRTTI